MGGESTDICQLFKTKLAQTRRYSLSYNQDLDKMYIYVHLLKFTGIYFELAVFRELIHDIVLKSTTLMRHSACRTNTGKRNYIDR